MIALSAINHDAHLNYLHPNRMPWEEATNGDELDFLSNALIGAPGEQDKLIAYLGLVPPFVAIKASRERIITIPLTTTLRLSVRVGLQGTTWSSSSPTIQVSLDPKACMTLSRPQ